MMTRSLLLTFFSALLLIQCKNLEDAEPANRSTFIYFYEKSRNYEAKVLEPTGDGFVMGGDLTQNRNDLTNAVVSLLDSRGNIQWETSLDSMSVASIKPVSDGYLVWGSKITLIDTAANLNNRVITSAQLYKLGLDGSISLRKVFRNVISNERTADIAGDAIIIGNNRLILIGNYKLGTQPTGTFVAELNPSSLDPLWLRPESLINRNYKNTSTAFFTSDQNILWASGAEGEIQNTDFSYITIPVLEPQASFINFGQYGQNDNQNYRAGALCQSALGFGVTGTYIDITSRVSNLFFTRVDANGNPIPGSDIFLDAISSQANTALDDKSASQADEEGLAIAATNDGGFILAGSMTTTTGVADGNRGNGGKDLWLIRLDAFGNILWNKNYGGSGDEVPSAVHQTADGGMIICGSSTVANLKSVFIMKTDRNGEIEK
jgi:hypothetical protein